MAFLCTDIEMMDPYTPMGGPRPEKKEMEIVKTVKLP